MKNSVVTTRLKFGHHTVSVLTKVGIIQTTGYQSNEIGIDQVSKILERLGKSEVDIVCLPEQWLPDNKIRDFEVEFTRFRKLAKEYSMCVIPGAFYEKSGKTQVISAPVIDDFGQMVGKQEKIHPFDYECDMIKAGTKANVFSAKCKFGIIICYDMVFPNVAETLVRKGAQILFSPSRIVRRGIFPWHLYIQTRALENRIPILAANVQDKKFGGKSIIVNLIEDDGVMIPKTRLLIGQTMRFESLDLTRYESSRKVRYSDHRRFS